MTPLDQIKSDDFNRWKHHPVSKVYLQFLRDFSAQLVSHIHDEWLSGKLSLLDEKEARGRVLLLNELAELKFVSIQSFYGVEEQDEPSAEADQN